MRRYVHDYVAFGLLSFAAVLLVSLVISSFPELSEDAGVVFIAERKVSGPRVAGAAITSGLVGYWGFDEGSGTTAADGSGNGNTGTLTNGPTWQTSGSCKVNGCLNFDGSNDYVAINNSSSMNPTTSFSFVGWIKLSTAPYIYRSGSGAWNIQIFGNKLTLTKPAVSDSSANSTISTNVWHHIAIVKSGDSGTNLTFYLDGTADGSVAMGTITPSSDEKQIGRFDGTRNMNGLMDEIYLFNR